LSPDPGSLDVVGHLNFRRKNRGLLPRGLAFLAVLIILVMLVIIIGNIVIGSAGIISWEFLTHPPEQGMEAGGIFPAIFGTVALVILMVIAVVPVGVFTAIYLQEYTVSRGAGEVAPIMFTGAAYYLPYLPTRLNDQFMELGYHIYVMATQSPDIEATKPILYGTVLVLLLLTFALNSVAILIRSRMRRNHAGTR